MHWALYSVDDEIIANGSKDVALRYGESVQQDTLDFADALAQHGRRRLYLRLWLDMNGETVSQQTVFFTAPRFLDLRRAPVHTTIRTHDDGTTEIALRQCSSTVWRSTSTKWRIARRTTFSICIPTCRTAFLCARQTFPKPCFGNDCTRARWSIAIEAMP